MNPDDSFLGSIVDELLNTIILKSGILAHPIYQ